MSPSVIRSLLTVDVSCFRCNTRPVMKVYENRSMAVLFCESCEHSWVVKPSDIPVSQTTATLSESR